MHKCYNYTKIKKGEPNLEKLKNCLDKWGHYNYAFKPFKVAISGFNKKSVFALVYNKQGKPIMLDDTCYYLGFDDFKISLIAMLILNSKIVQEFIKSIAFLDSKRPYTKEILMRIDFLKVVKVVTFNVFCK